MIIFSSLLISCQDSGDLNEIEPKETVILGQFLDDWTYQVFPDIRDNFDIAEFRVWTPKNNLPPRAILVLASSFNSNALNLALSEEWQEYAKTENIALLGVHLESNSSGSYYPFASDGSGKAMNTALKMIAKKNQLTQLIGLPIMAKGYSAGGAFSYYLSDYLPERVLAFANIRGGVGSTSRANSNSMGLMIIGEHDVESNRNSMRNAVRDKRRISGLWSYVVEPDVDHYGDLDKADAFIKTFFSLALEKKLAIDGTSQLQIIPESIGWLGDNENLQYFIYDDFHDDKTNASWLPNEEFAKAWKEFQLK